MNNTIGMIDRHFTSNNGGNINNRNSQIKHESMKNEFLMHLQGTGTDSGFRPIWFS